MRARYATSAAGARASRNTSVHPASRSRARTAALIPGRSASSGDTELTVQWSTPASTSPANNTDDSTVRALVRGADGTVVGVDRKSTRLNSSHDQISYAVFCLKKKKVHLRC